MRAILYGLMFVVVTALILSGCGGEGSDESSSNSYSLGLDMISVPAGRFQRDATAANISKVSAFMMSKNEITREQFMEIMDADPSETAYSSGTSDPVQNVSWYHAITFCNKLSLAEGLQPVYVIRVGGAPINWKTLTFNDVPTSSNDDWAAVTAVLSNNGYRLPTEMEWMWAAMGAPADGRGGGINTTGYQKPFSGSTGSNSIGSCAVYGYYESGIGRTTAESTNPVGNTASNGLGLCDMSGNVWEWCGDWHDSYPGGEKSDYLGSPTGTNRVKRGGYWGSSSSDCTVAWRSQSDPMSHGFPIGFRVVRR